MREWTLYGDEELNTLQKRLVENSPDLAASLARYRAGQGHQRPDPLRPVSDPDRIRQRATYQAVRDEAVARVGPTSPNEYSSYTIGLEADYEFDLWGRIRNQVASGDASRQPHRRTWNPRA